MAECRHDVRQPRQVLAHGCSESTRSSGCGRPSSSDRWRAGAVCCGDAASSGCASGARERVGSEDGTVRAVADLVHSDSARARSVGDRDSVGDCATLGARVAVRGALRGGGLGEGCWAWRFGGGACLLHDNR